MKRSIDFILSIIGIIILSPVLLIISILIKISTTGPIFFTQNRVGKKGRMFLIYKFRTMVLAAESLGPKITIGQDMRVTPIGRILRKTKLDELPQLFNVILGDMAIVGPRPEVSEYVDLYDANIREIVLSVRPGITDYASILMIDEGDVLAKSNDPKATYINEIMPQKLDLAMKYVKEQNLIIDLKIIFLTIFKVFSR